MQLTFKDGKSPIKIQKLIANELFQFQARAGLVNSNTTIDMDIITTGGVATTDTLQIVILNDYTPPSLSNNLPQDNGFLRQGISNQPISIDVEDNETGILNASFSYWDCSINATNVTTYTKNLTCTSTTCTSQGDFSAYQEGESMCFEFNVYNNALERATLNGTVGFDGTAPSVTLLAPADGSYGTNSTIFSFNATDNLAPTLTCNFLVDNQTIATTIATNGAITNTAYDMSNVSEGNHNWNVNCTDWVGLSSLGAQRSIIIDKTAPSITLVSPSNGSMIGDDVLIDIDVTDNYEVANVNYSISLNSTDLPEGINVLTVTATDGAGNQAQAIYTFIVDRTDPTIIINSPADNASSDVHTSFVFDTNDNLDPTLTCTLYIDNTARITQSVNNNQTANFSIILPMAQYTWYLTCFDDAGNSQTTIQRNLNVTDLSGPDIVSDITYVARTEAYPFDVNVTDISGVNNVNLWFDGSQLNVTNSGDLYSSTIQTTLANALGNYTLTINANDTLGNDGTLADVFTLVQGYIVTLNLNPNSVTEGNNVDATGTVTLDDGSLAPESQLTLFLPSGSVNVTITNGTYSHSFIESNAGTYEITSSIVSSEGFNHTTSQSLTVNAKAGSSSSSSSSSSSGGGDKSSLFCGDGMCTTAMNENCNSCAADCGVCPVEEAPQQIQESSDDNDNFIIQENATLPQEPRIPSGVGQASGWFSRLASNPWIWALFLMIIAALYLMSSRKEKIDWNGYFDK